MSMILSTQFYHSRSVFQQDHLCFVYFGGGEGLSVKGPLYYQPPTKLREGNVFVCSQGGSPCDHYPCCIGLHLYRQGAVSILLECFLVTNLLCAFVVNRKMAFYAQNIPNKTSRNLRQIFPPLRMVYVRAENQFITIF